MLVLVYLCVSHMRTDDQTMLTQTLPRSRLCALAISPPQKEGVSNRFAKWLHPATAKNLLRSPQRFVISALVLACLQSKGAPKTKWGGQGFLYNCAQRSVDKTRCFEVIGGNYSQSDQTGNYFSYNTIYTLMFSAMQSEYEAK